MPFAVWIVELGTTVPYMTSP